MASSLKNIGRCALLAMALSGCAAQMAFRDGNDLIAKNQIEAGLAKYQEAVRAEPGNAEYRSVFLSARDRATLQVLDKAERDQAEGRTVQAEQGFRRVLAIDGQNERAVNGLRALERDSRQARQLDLAAQLLNSGQYELAKQKLNAILSETPANEKARLMLREAADKTAAPAVESGLAKSYKQPISIEFRDAPLKQVFEIISRRSGLNFVFDKDVKTDQKTTVLLKNSTVESAIYFLLLTNQLEQQVMDANTILIYPNVAAKIKEYQEMTVKTFFLANAEAKLVANTLKTILKSRDVVVDEKLNLLIVRDTPEAIRLAERLIALQDTAEAEVMLEVEILEVKRSALTDLGVVWPTGLTFAPIASSTSGTITINDLRNLNGNTIGVTGATMGINANKNAADSNLLANPRIRVRNKEKAKIVIGDKLPVITSTVSGVSGFASDSVTYVDVGLTLQAEPTIYLNNEVAIRMQLEVSNLVSTVTTKNGTTAYQLGTRQASTMLQLKDGENQVLAGLINNEERNSSNKVPGFAELPVVSRLFGSQRDDNQKTEIVLSITPHLIRNVQRPEASAAEFSAGTDASFRRRPDLTPRTPVAPAGLPPQARPAGAVPPAGLPSAAPSATTPPVASPVQATNLSETQPAPLPASTGAQPQAVQPPAAEPAPVQQ
ncbi:general secretion pathway protein GspD [Duganella sp. FT80W]|uniref:General secretion pathway protein GspD n=1 Tax=Duganella guangzhouensis TaxID=2666084 RepID=A0A6I2L5V5_9BURK|nr:secretin N-terminal domain-containing protein [Duganella guangzhouensis]MRW93062.1 general secretion pathway protein GspD [Duganella guangzhouensis]